MSLEMTRGAKIARLQPPLSVKLSRVLLCEECLKGGGPTWTDITVSHLLLCIFALAQIQRAQIYPDTPAGTHRGT